MKKLLLLAMLVAIVAAFGAGSAYAGGNTKIQICHIPPGNPDNIHTIEISEKAYSYHLAHGDLAGECEAACSEVTVCGTVIDQPGCYVLANDLTNCSSHGIQITSSNVTLFMDGHTIDGIRPGGTHGTPGGGVGIWVHNDGVPAGVSNVEIIGPGTCQESHDACIAFYNTHNSLVRDVTATDSKFGFAINHDFSCSGNCGFGPSSGNQFISNNASGNWGHGFTLNGGDNNQFIGNQASNSVVGYGFAFFDSNGNTVSGNVVNGNSGSGISVWPGQVGNVIEGNTAQGNGGPDLQDQNNNCVNNTWLTNTFGSSSPACIQ